MSPPVTPQEIPGGFTEEVLSRMGWDRGDGRERPIQRLFGYQPSSSEEASWEGRAEQLTDDFSAMTHEVEASLSYDQVAADFVPVAGSTYDLGSDDKPFRKVTARALSLDGTQTVQNGVLHMYRQSVLEFEKNYSLLVLPVYDKGYSPYDYWHSSSSYYRDGGFWVQRGSPAKLMVRGSGYDRMVGHWDTGTCLIDGAETTCTMVGTVLWERTCSYRVRLSETQFTDTASLTVEMVAPELTDPAIKGASQVGSLVSITSVDQTDTGTVNLPDIGGNTYDWMLAGLDQTDAGNKTYSGSSVFTGVCLFTNTCTIDVMVVTNPAYLYVTDSTYSGGPVGSSWIEDNSLTDETVYVCYTDNAGDVRRSTMTTS